ncbi:unnamed protein product [Polarella glacialis]|uniref:Pentatricopeptide repeat-containing protein, chloroplastic n=1 Tax=Polarella glacialis TaxID=89957 RepID=A0A813LC32_POLGL|nr:unnamed protein product [Polarella glacialis]
MTIPSVVRLSVSAVSLPGDPSAVIKRRHTSGSQRELAELTASITALSRSSGWFKALGLLQRLLVQGLVPDIIICNAAAAACKQGSWERTLLLFSELPTRKLAPSGRSFSTAASACAAGHRWQEAVGLLTSSRDLGVEADVVTLSSALHACRQARLWRHALSLLTSSRQGRLRLDVIACSSTISACEKDREWRQALALWSCARDWGISANVVTLNALVSSCEKSAHWCQAMQLLLAAAPLSLELDVVSHNAGLSALENGLRWQEALGLLRQMPASALRPDPTSHNAAISACEKCLSWAWSLQLLRELRHLQMEPDEFGRSAAVSACSKASRWQAALRLVLGSCRPSRLRLVEGSEVRSGSLSAAACGAAASACEAGGRWLEAFELLDLARRSRCSPDVLALGAVAGACDAAGRHTIAMQLWLQIEQSMHESLQPPSQSSSVRSTLLFSKAVSMSPEVVDALLTCGRLSSRSFFAVRRQVIRPVVASLHALLASGTSFIRSPLRSNGQLPNVHSSGVSAGPPFRDERLERQFGLSSLGTLEVLRWLGTRSPANTVPLDSWDTFCAAWLPLARLESFQSFSSLSCLLEVGEHGKGPAAKAVSAFVAFSLLSAFPSDGLAEADTFDFPSQSRGRATGHRGGEALGEALGEGLGLPEVSGGLLSPVYVRHDRASHAERLALLQVLHVAQRTSARRGGTSVIVKKSCDDLSPCPR